MKLLALVLRQRRLQRRLLGFALLAFGVFTALLVWILSYAINLPTGQRISPEWFFMALISLAIATVARHHLLLQVVLLLEQATCDIRLDVLGRLRDVAMRDIETIGRDALHESLVVNTRAISNAGVMLTKLLVLGARLLAVLLALLFISPLALFITLVVLGLLSIVLVLVEVRESHPGERGLRGGVYQLLRGFKEIKLHQRRGDEFLAREVDGVLRREWRQRSNAGQRIALAYIGVEAITLLLAGLLVFALPGWSPAFADTAVRAAVVVLCLPTTLLRDTPLVGRAEAALERLSQVEKTLQAALTDPIPAAAGIPASFRELTFREVCFRYNDPAGNVLFTVGPLSFTLSMGTITFIVGDNGSGKSTLLKLLTGLYPPVAGTILLDGQPVGMTDYRELFAAIFTDFHLFDRLYGQEDMDEARVNGLLRQLEIDDRVQFRDGAFNTLSLSSAQRKRLALVVALLEDRPIYVLDEWAADQDPVLREQYYRTLLPTLQARGKTVVAVTHDERFLSLADRILRLKNGQLVNNP